MKNVQPGSAFVNSNTNSQVAFSTPTHSSVFVLPTASTVTQTQRIRSLAMHHSGDPSGLWQQILQIASTTPDFNLIPGKLAVALGQAFGVDGCIVLIPKMHQTAYRMSYWLLGPPTALVESVWTSCQIPEEVAGSGTVLITNTEADLSDADAISKNLVDLWQSLPLSAEAGSFPPRSICSIMTRHQGQINGWISLMRRHPHNWSDVEIAELNLLVQPIAIALSQVQLQLQLNEQMESQAVVNQLTMAIRNSSNLNQILNLAVDGAARALHAHRGMLLRLKYLDPLFRSYAQEQIPKARVTVVCEWLDDESLLQAADWQPDATISTLHSTSQLNHSFWITECGLCQQAFLQSPAPITISSPHKLPRVNPAIDSSPVFHLDSLPSLLLVPLENQGSVLGFLVFQYRQPHVWQPEEVELVELVSAQVSTAIMQTETLRQVQTLVEKRTAELRESLSVQAKLYERTRQQIDQLRHLNKLKDEFLSAVNHELRTPLTSMALAIRMLRQSNLSAERSRRYLDILEKQCIQETNLINDLLALQELETKRTQIQLQEIDLKALIKQLETSFQQPWAVKGLVLALDMPKHPLKLRSDLDSLNRILLELLTNAGKYADPNTAIGLKLRLNREQPVREVELTLSNIGPGISAEELPYIFEKFHRSQGATQNAIQGTGLGLALVKSLVQHINGLISVSSLPVEGTSSFETCFVLSLPQAFDRTILE
jgi:signal transduction histidine kinase